MEIRLENKIKLFSGSIIGIFDNDGYFINYINNMYLSKDCVYYNKKKLNQKELILLRKKISIIDKYILSEYLEYTVYEYMKRVIMSKSLDLKNYRKKIIDSLKIVGLSDSFLSRKVSSLSRSEETFLLFAVGLLSNPDIIIFDEVLNSLDVKNRKKILRLLQQLTEQYEKIVVIVSRKIEDIYKYGEYIIILNNNTILKEGTSSNIFEVGLDILLKNNIDIPKTTQFSYLVNNSKNVKLGYFNDVRDLIKDIYKKV